jgi:hypothetical protein
MRWTVPLLALIAVPGVAAAQDYHFTHDIAAGGQIEIDNINGPIDVMRAPGRTFEVTVTKTVRRGNGALVKSVMESTGHGVRVCTVYLNNPDDTAGCEHNSRHSDHGDHLEVEMHYVAHVPDGADLTVNDVNGAIAVTGVNADAHIEGVNGNVTFDGASASSIETTNGEVKARFTRADWQGTLSIQTVNGGVDLTFPAALNADVHGETVNGSIESAFPVTIEGKFGPKSFDGRIGSGGRKLSIETVNGTIRLQKQ